ncbi:MAG: Rpn family recombination-promoting nuclease/putative transposase [Lachnospiraceae bacterium]|nr:Rpn family recombination-promoting nuclease/putative transposase [Lachnospiraceae bacterium]
MKKVPENKNNDKYNISDNLTNGNDFGAAAPGSDVLFQQNASFPPAERRNYKDSVFVDLFYTDQNAGENLLSLYNALYDDSLTDVHALKGVRLENVLYMPFANDIAFTVESKKIILGEHQSTLNRNMPLRCLLYVAREYEQLIPVRRRFRTKAAQIPTPYFIIFYNGKAEQEKETLLRLSDAYQEKSDTGAYALELEVRMININQKAGHPILEKCPVLKEYSEFVEHVRAYGNNEQKLTEAVKECIRKGILSEYLKRKSREVINMLIGEYDYEMDMQEKQDEVREELEEVIAEAKAAEARAKKAAAEARAEKAKAEKAAAENTKHLLSSLVQKGLLSVKDAAAEMGVSEDTFLKWIE